MAWRCCVAAEPIRAIDNTPPRALHSGMGRIVVIVALMCGLAACDSYPRDSAGTLDSVRARQTIRLGLASTERTDQPILDRLSAELGKATGARIQVTGGSEEELLARLEHGELDLVAGHFAEDSPWLADAALIEPLASRPVGERNIGLALVARNGENAWIGLLEATVRDVRGDR